MGWRAWLLEEWQPGPPGGERENSAVRRFVLRGGRAVIVARPSPGTSGVGGGSRRTKPGSAGARSQTEHLRGGAGHFLRAGRTVGNYEITFICIIVK